MVQQNSLLEQVAPLLDVISQGEIGKNYKPDDAYNTIYGGKKVALTKMSVKDVLSFQKQRISAGSPSSAVGRFQFIHKTLKGLVKELGISKNALFDGELQDRLGLQLLKRRGLDNFLNGKTNNKQFTKSLSKEWASLPKDSSGKSYYAGDNLNKAHISYNELGNSLNKIKNPISQFAQDFTNTIGKVVGGTIQAIFSPFNNKQPAVKLAALKQSSVTSDIPLPELRGDEPPLTTNIPLPQLRGDEPPLTVDIPLPELKRQLDTARIQDTPELPIKKPSETSFEPGKDDPNFITYTIQKGDTLTGIFKKQGLGGLKEALAYATEHNIDPTKLQIGQQLTLNTTPSPPAF